MASNVPTEWVGLSDGGLTYLIVSVCFVSLAVVCVLLRIWARMHQYGRLFADDYFSIAAMLVALVLLAWAFVLPLRCGLGHHITEMPPAQAVEFIKASDSVFLAAELTYTACATLYKLAVLFLYYRIFGNIRSFNISSWILIGCTVAWGIGCILSGALQCVPIERLWYPQTPGHCINTKALIMGNGISNLILDALILLLPVPVVWRLQLTASKKLALTGMFLLGAIVLVASIVRVTTLSKIDLLDPSYTAVQIAIWSEIEPALGIVGACLPTLRQFLFKKVSQSQRSQSYESRYRANHGSSEANHYATGKSAKSNIAIALTGWSDTDTYTEIHGADSIAQTPASANAEFYGSDNRSQRISHDLPDEEKSIYVTTEVVVARN